MLRNAVATCDIAGVTDTAPGTISTVQVYRDVNGNDVIDAGDVLLGAAAKLVGTNNYRLLKATTGFATGVNKFIAKATEAAKANDTTAILQASTTGPTIQPIRSGCTV